MVEEPLVKQRRKQCQRHYPIRDGIPVMLIDEALTPEQAASATS